MMQILIHIFDLLYIQLFNTVNKIMIKNNDMQDYLPYAHTYLI